MRVIYCDLHVITTVLYTVRISLLEDQLLFVYLIVPSPAQRAKRGMCLNAMDLFEIFFVFLSLSTIT